MADDFGLKIGIDGEKEFKKALSDINQSFKVLGSEMKLVESQFDENDKSVQALSARNAVLNKEIEVQRGKIETLCDALSNASESFGETDRRTQNWRIKLNQAQAELNKMERAVDSNAKAIDSMSGEMGDISDEERFQKSLSDIDASFKVLGSELALVDARFGKTEKSTESLSARNAVLNKEIEAQKNKIDTLRSALEHSADSYGENDQRTRDWQVQLNQARAALIKMGHEVSSNAKAISSMSGEMGDTSDEEKFKKSLASIDSEFKVLGSELKLVDSQFGKNEKSVESLSARNTVLNKEIEVQERKVSTLRSALEHSAEAYGENDERTRDWQIQLNKAQAELNGLQREVKDNEKAIDEMGREMDDAADDANDLSKGLDDAGDAAEKSGGKFEKMGSVLKGIGAAIGATVAAAGAAAVKLGKEVISAYADYEQLVGGVDTLFKESSGKLQDYAANAYKTAGMDANAYMETVTGFSASLIQSLSGDTEKAVKYADMAITDMSDNANKMGSDMASIQSAYQGFAKQNYTMLDNLKLGYGGTKTEMERLLKDASEIAIKNGLVDVSTRELKVDTEALDKAQKSLTKAQSQLASAEESVYKKQIALEKAQISYNAAVKKGGKESASAQKALLSLKQAQHDLALAQEKQTQAANAATSAQNAYNTAVAGTEAPIFDISSYADVVEAIHVIQTSMDITGTTAKEAEHTISGSINSMKSAIQNLVVGFGRADADIGQLCNNVVDAFKDVLTNIMPVIENIVSALPTVTDALLTAIADLLPYLLETVATLFSQVLSTILQLLPELIPAAVEAVLTIVGALVDNLPLLIDAAVQLVQALVVGIGEALPALIPAAVNAIITIVKGLVDSLPMLLDAALQLITGLAQGLLDAIPVLIEALPEIITSLVQFLIGAIPQIIDAGIQLLTSLVTALPDIIAAIVEVIPLIIDGLVTALLDGLPQIIKAGIQLLTSLVAALPEIIIGILTVVPAIIDGLVTSLVESIPQIVEAGVQLLVSLVENLPTIINGISSAIPKIINGLVNDFTSGNTQIADAGITLLTSLVKNLPFIISTIAKAAPQIIQGFITTFKGNLDAIVNIGGSLAKGLWQGIQQMKDWLWKKVSGWISSIWDGICDFFGIHSPSREMAWVGEMLVDGLAGSIDDNGGQAVSAAEEMAGGVLDAFNGLSADLSNAFPDSFALDVDTNPAVSAAEDMAKDINGVFNGLAADMTNALPSNIDISARANVSGALSGGNAAQTTSIGSLVTVQQMIVRSEDDVRKISQDLYDMIQTGSRAQGRFAIA